MAEMGHRLGTAPAPLQTIFVGGGTPTLLPGTDLRRLLAAARRFGPDAEEYTVEANPESLSAQCAETMTEAAVNRVSLGAQSFNEAELRLLDRRHTPGAVVRAIAQLRGAGIRNINLDLIFGIPGQTLSGWRSALHQSLDLGVEHLSCYALTHEPGTPLSRRIRQGELDPCDNSLEADMYLAAIDLLTNAGFEHYEVSNFARPGRRCMHNMLYWRHGSYVGVGPAASGYVDGWRYRNVADVAEYERRMVAAGTAEAERERLTGRALAGEMAMLGLRLVDGLDVAEVRARCGVDLRVACAGTWERYAGQQLVQVAGDRITLTRAGLLVADTIIADVLADCGAEPKP